MRLGSRAVFYCEQAQQLFELNSTADAIWGALLGECTPPAAREALVRLGADAQQAEAYVRQQLGEWLRCGYWMPADISSVLPGGRLRVVIDELTAELSCDDPAALQRLGSVFGQFPTFSGRAEANLRIVAWGQGYHLFDAERYLGSCEPDELTPRIKAILTEMLVHRPGDGFFAHGALLERHGLRIILSGAPGAGKSTLALALASAGYRLLSDDVIKVDGEALMRGVPFSPALKEGSWPLLEGRMPQLPSWSIERRPDGQLVRYVPMSPEQQEARAPALFLALKRQAGAPAEALPLEPLDALSVMLSEAFSESGRLSASLMTRLVGRFGHVECRRLAYSDLDDAVARIESLCHEI